MFMHYTPLYHWLFLALHDPQQLMLQYKSASAHHAMPHAGSYHIPLGNNRLSKKKKNQQSNQGFWMHIS